MGKSQENNSYSTGGHCTHYLLVFKIFNDFNNANKNYKNSKTM